MKFAMRFKNVQYSEALTSYAQERLDRLERYEMKPLRVNVTVSSIRHQKVAEVYVNGLNGIFRARCSAENFQDAIDGVMKKLERQMEKEKSKVKNHRHFDHSSVTELGRMLRREKWRDAA